ncbi:MAG TPA: Rid family hydrolase [Thermoguttaceae bacterium]|nr:Rid family hydrolase [Thermoguttaceae bacterium]
MIRKESSDGIGYSVVELDDVRHVFASAMPRQGDTLQEQAHDALKTIEAVIEEEGTLGSIVKQAVFLKDINQLEACRQIMKEFYGDELPATTYIPQPPCQGKLIEIEALGVGRGLGEVEIERHSERLVITRHNGVDWVHLAHIFPETTATSVYDRSHDIFELTARGLEARRFRYDQVIRTWLYLGDIVGPEGDTQRYKELNRARTDFYQGIKFGGRHIPSGLNGSVFPASTGIGTEGKDVIMSSISLVTDRDDILLMPLENPRQTSAFDYSSAWGLKSPKFARAMAIAANDAATIFVSGTASIIDAETVFVGDVEGQTRQTLDNIEALISADNLSRHGMSGIGASLQDLALVRVYIKHQEDYAKTKAVCEARLGELPTIYAVGDVCRPELLVEIEGVAVAHPGSG